MLQRLVKTVQRLVEAEALRDAEEAAAEAARAAEREAELQRLQVRVDAPLRSEGWLIQCRQGLFTRNMM